MLGVNWISSDLAAEKLGITEIKLSFLRENGILKPGIHWKSSPIGQKKPCIYKDKTFKRFISN